MGVPAETDLSNRTALISGASSGIGLALARSFSGLKATVFNADIIAPENEAAATYVECDLTRSSAVDLLFQQLHQKNSLPDLLVCNAGRGISEKLTEGDPEKWKQVLELNVLGALRLIRAFVPQMLERGFGDVAVISSVAAGKAYPYGGIYAASKAALQTIAETLRLEVLPKVRVLTVAPGVTDTNFFNNSISGFQSADDIGYGALPPEEIADAIVYALLRPREISLNHLTIRPGLQVF